VVEGLFDDLAAVDLLEVRSGLLKQRLKVLPRIRRYQGGLPFLSATHDITRRLVLSPAFVDDLAQ
jgi:hypothetical protein